MKKTISIIFILIIIGCGSEKNRPNISKYRVRISNWVGGQNHFCESFKVKNNTYYLYDKNGELTSALTANNGYAIVVSKQK